jgi:molybdopterin-synthase adenylyltransferase
VHDSNEPTMTGGRYAAHCQLPEIGPSGQERLRQRRVLVVGLGGLGSPAALALAAAGLGTLGLIDGDTVDRSNLHRQILYRDADLGRSKVRITAERIGALNPDVRVRAFETRLSAHNLAELFAEFDFVIDATDDIATKYLVNDGAVLQPVPFSHAGVVGFQGQTMTVIPKRSACVRCVFPLPPVDGDIPTCQETGIIGALAGSIGLVQAAEALKSVLGIGGLLTDRFLTYDALAARWRTIALARNPQCPVCGEAPTIRHLPLAEAAEQPCR